MRLIKIIILKNLLILIALVLSFFSPISLYSQTNVIKSLINIDAGEYEIEELFGLIERQTNLTISYNPKQFDLDPIFISALQQPLEDLLYQVFGKTDLRILNTKKRRIVLSFSNSTSSIIIKGYVRDSISGAPIAHVEVFNKENELLGVTSKNGFYKIKIKENDLLKFDHLAFRLKMITPNQEAVLNNVTLNFENTFPEILITSNQYKNSPFATKILNVHKLILDPSVLGDDKISKAIRSLPGIQSGNEGQSGFFSRGGSNDQNLILIDGVPIYETSHLAGFSSLFSNELVSSLAINIGSFPASKGGRLSSIIDVNLKSSLVKKTKGTVNLNLTTASADMEMPINSKISVYGQLKKSLTNFMYSPLLKKSLSYDHTDLHYYDGLLKVVFKPKENHDLNFLLIKGNDKIDLARLTTSRTLNSEFLFDETNFFNWNNNVYSLDYNFSFNNSLFYKFHVYSTDYINQSQGRYFFSETINEVSDTNFISISSYSNIFNRSIESSFEIYPSKDIRVDLGIKYRQHEFTPTIHQSDIINSNLPISFVEGDSTIISQEFTTYLELEYNLNKQIQINAGGRISNYSVRSTNHFSFEPRVNISLFPSPTQKLCFSYARLSQQSHLLINPSLGIPSDLWVPSTNLIAPEFANHLNLDYSIKMNAQLYINISPYYKLFYNILEYNNATDVFYNLINQGDFIPVFNSTNEWERRVSIGKGRAYGIDFDFEYSLGDFTSRLVYSISRSEKIFQDINDGNYFRSRFDRPHDLNVNFQYFINPSLNISCNFIYGSGNTFTLATQSIAIDDFEFVAPTSRNNYRLRSYHHMDVSISKNFLLEKSSFDITLGIYNIYNRLNPYYAYVYKNSQINKPVLRQISLFPFTPQISVTYKFE